MCIRRCAGNPFSLVSFNFFQLLNPVLVHFVWTDWLLNTPNSAQARQKQLSPLKEDTHKINLINQKFAELNEMYGNGSLEPWVWSKL